MGDFEDSAKMAVAASSIAQAIRRLEGIDLPEVEELRAIEARLLHRSDLLHDAGLQEQMKKLGWLRPADNAATETVRPESLGTGDWVRIDEQWLAVWDAVPLDEEYRVRVSLLRVDGTGHWTYADDMIVDMDEKFIRVVRMATPA